MSSEAPKCAGPSETIRDATARGVEPPNIQSPRPAPINRLPFDIFQVIIAICQEGSETNFPFIVSHVSRLWRAYVLSMPLLWNSLHIRQHVPQWEMLEAKLERSGQAPLDIYIGQAPFVKSAIPHLRKIIRMIFPHMGRWRALHLDDAPYKIRRILLDRIRAKSAPLLQEIQVFESSSFDDRPSRLKLKNTSPHWNATNVLTGFLNLDSVIWTSSVPDVNALPTFRNLKKLTIGEGTLSGISLLPFVQLIHRILSDSPSLEALTIYPYPTGTWNPEGEATDLQLPTLTHHSLQRLFIESSDKFRSTAIRTLILPKLRVLSTLHYMDSVNLSCCDIIARENSLPELRVIGIAGDVDVGRIVPEPSFRSHMPFLRPAIQNLTNLRVLTFRAIDFSDERWLPHLGSCCPHLRWLLFVFCTGFTIPSIRLIVEARIHANGINPLEILCIQPYPYAPEPRATEKDVAWFSKFLKFKQVDDCWHTDYRNF